MNNQITDPQPEIKNKCETIKDFFPLFNEKIKKAKRVVLMLHKSPDLDSAGSNFGIRGYLKEINPEIEIKIISADKPSSNISDFITKESDVPLEIIDPATFNFSSGDLAVSIDFADISRATRQEFKIPNQIDQTIIDHHVIPAIEDKLNFINTGFMSSSSIVFYLYKEAEIKIPRKDFEFLILGLLGDSGFLRFRDKNFLSTLEIIANFCKNYDTGTYFDIIEYLESNKSPEEFILQGIYLSNLVYDKDKNYAYTHMMLEERKSRGVPVDYVEVINGAMSIRNIGNAEFVFSVNEDKKEANKYNISFRTCSGSKYVVRTIAEKLGGGGHPSAAGVQIDASSMQDAIERVKSAINELNGLRN